MMNVQANCSNQATDAQLQAIRGMGIQYLAVNFLPDAADLKSVTDFQKRAARFGLEIADAGCPALQKCPQIHLGKPDRDEWIRKYNDFTRVLGQAGIHVNYLAWQPTGIFRSQIGQGKHTRGEHAMICDLKELEKRPLAADRIYSQEEIWDNFRYFLDQALPVCEQSGVRLALHPNDPPVESLCGIPSLIWNTACYRKAFELAGNSPFLGMKMCIGCWLENSSFGNLMEDIETFARQDKILVVHFRNVSSALPYFEETLLEDGYGDMFSILEQLIRCGYQGPINIDHPFFDRESGKISPVSEAYFLGYLKGMLAGVCRGLAHEKED